MQRREFLSLAALAAVDFKGTIKLLDQDIKDNNLDRILRVNETAEPYLGHVLDACKKHSSTFPLPPAFPAFLFHFESSYDRLAWSSTGAFGIAQFIIRTAREEGLHTISEKEDPYHSMKEAYKKYTKTARRAQRMFDWNRFDQAIELKRQVPALRRDYQKKFRAAKDHYQSIFRDQPLEITDKIDERANPFLSIDKGVGYLAKLARAVKHDTGLNDAYVLLLAAAGYNAGLNATLNTFRGIPLYEETMKYVNRLMMSYGKLHE